MRFAYLLPMLLGKVTRSFRVEEKDANDAATDIDWNVTVDHETKL